MRHPLERFRKATPPKPIVQKYPSLWDVISVVLKQAPLISLGGSSCISIDWANEGERARKVISRRNLRVTYKCPSQKNQRMVHCESLIELAAMLVLDACPDVKRFSEQPAKITYPDIDGVLRAHIPDIFVELTNGARLFLEMKADSDSEDEELLWRTSFLKKELTKHGIQYLLVFGSQVPAAIQEDARKLLKHSRYPVTADQREAMRLSMADKQVTFAEAVEMANPIDINSENFVCSLVYEGSINLINMSLNASSMLQWR